MKGYKGLHEGLISKWWHKQYKENEIYEEEILKIRKNGIHFSSDPSEVFWHYPLMNKDGSFNEYVEVEALGKVETSVDINHHVEHCTDKIKIGNKVKLDNLIKIGSYFITNKSKTDEFYIASSKDDDLVTVKYHHIKAGNLHNKVKMLNPNRSNLILNSGDNFQLDNTASYVHVGNVGNYAHITNCGDYDRIVNFGNCINIINSGKCVWVGDFGDGTHIINFGNDALIKSFGNNSSIVCLGKYGKVQARRGSYITLAEWRYEAKTEDFILAGVKTERVDGQRIKEDTLYKLKLPQGQEKTLLVKHLNL